MSQFDFAEISVTQLLQLEQQARRSGSGVEAEALQGCWQLERVWSKGQQHAAVFSGRMLHGFAARLEIGADHEGLLLSDAVNLGGWSCASRGAASCRASGPCCCSALIACS
jgi:hypothetical protein